MKTHGLSNSVEYVIWAGVKARCLNPKNQNYPRYGGRGIMLQKTWLKFENFYRDMGPRPEGCRRQFTLERRNNNGPYSKKNCHWATYEVQARNKRSNVWVVFQGVRMVLKDAATASGFTFETLQSRLRMGWSVSRLFAPIAQVRQVTVQGRQMSVREAANHYGLNLHTVQARIADGAPANEWFKPPAPINAPKRKRQPIVVYKNSEVGLRDLVDSLGRDLDYKKIYQRLHTYGWPLDKALHTP